MREIDPDLIRACMKEDRLAQSRLYRCCFDILMGVCVRYYNNQEDAVGMLNMGFLKILRNLDKLKPEVPFEAWIRRIMINTIIDDFRKNKKHRELIQYTDFEIQPEDGTFIDLNEADSKFDASALEAMIHALPEMSRKVFNLYAIDGYSHKEIAKLLGMSDGTSKWHVAFARKKLKEMMAKALRTVHTFLL